MNNKRTFQPIQKKSLSQVFLRDDWPCRKMTDLLSGLGVQSVIEIGPGGGILTRVLLANGINVTAIEKDERFAERLGDLAKETSFTGQLTVINADALRFDLAAWLAETPGRKAICGNIPYHISSPILQWLLPHIQHVRGVLLMVQLEFGERLASQPSAKTYGSLSVYTQLRAKAKLEFKVERTCFHPVPKVDSVVVSLAALAKMEPEETLRKVEMLTQRAFTQRRKMLSNSLAPFLKDTGSIGFDLTRRCDSLSPAEFVELTKILEL